MVRGKRIAGREGKGRGRNGKGRFLLTNENKVNISRILPYMEGGKVYVTLYSVPFLVEYITN